MIPWILVAVLSITLAAIATRSAARAWQAAGRKVDALADLSPSYSPAEVAELTTVLIAASKHGAAMTDIAADVLAEGYRKRQVTR